LARVYFWEWDCFLGTWFFLVMKLFWAWGLSFGKQGLFLGWVWLFARVYFWACGCFLIG
jgi:hypothetical protein